jgi:sulfate transporter 3
VNFHAACLTPMSNVVVSVCIMLVLLFLAPLFKYTPPAEVGVRLICAVAK